ncbi:MAG: class I SAM-dependent methyltransferase [Betaproteobacteria bacterium]|nr:class I SAM-dependent methyltransferase [Betaproteobacteria bacterium]
MTNLLPDTRRLVVALMLAQAGTVQAWDDGTVPFVVSPEEVVDRMLRIAELRAEDYLLDLGSGDGRIVIEAARRGARGLGVDIDSSLVARARQNAARAGVADRARFETRDLFETDLSPASVITLYLLPEVNLKLMPRLLALKPGTRVVSHDWDMGSWLPDETVELRIAEKPVGADLHSRIHLWVVPADARGSWTSEMPGYGGSWRFQIAQTLQVLDVSAQVAGIEMLVRGTRLRGSEIRMVLSGLVAGHAAHHLFRGVLRGDRIEGELTISDGEERRTMSWQATRTTK